MTSAIRPFGDDGNSPYEYAASAGLTALDLSCSTLMADPLSVRAETWL
jgi:hypothetical protein